MTLLTIRIEGGLLSPDFLETIHDQPGQKPFDFGLDARRSLVDEVTAVWSDVRAYWEAFERRRARAKDGESLTTATREAWIIPLLEALGYRLTFQRRAAEADGRSYAISHRATGVASREVGSREIASREIASREVGSRPAPPTSLLPTTYSLLPDSGPPVHIVAFDQKLGERSPSGRSTMAPHALVQDYLNRSDDTWGIVTNGATLRLLRDSVYFSRPSYVEFDLQGMLEGERLDEFILFYRLAHRTRLAAAGEDGSRCLLESYHQAAIEQGGRIRDGLRKAVEGAILTLANGFLSHPKNGELRRAIAGNELSASAYYQQLLYLIYRLLFLMVAEERNLLASSEVASSEMASSEMASSEMASSEMASSEMASSEMASSEMASSATHYSLSNYSLSHYSLSHYSLSHYSLSHYSLSHYSLYYSITRLRRLAEAPLSGPQRFDDLYLSLRTLFQVLRDETQAPALGVPALNGELFDVGRTRHLEAAYLNNRDLLSAIRQLSYFTPEKEHVRRRVNYAALDVEELGSVYESLLDEHPVIEGVASGEVGSREVGSREVASRATHYSLSRYSLLPRFSFVQGTERKTTGSYYTARELVKETLDSALDPVIREIVSGEIASREVGSRTKSIHSSLATRYSPEGKVTDGEKTDPVLPRSRGVAEGDGSRRSVLQADEELSAGRIIRHDLTDSESRGVGAGEHRGGAWPGASQRIRSVPADRSGISEGSGDTSDPGGSRPADDRSRDSTNLRTVRPVGSSASRVDSLLTAGSGEVASGEVANGEVASGEVAKWRVVKWRVAKWRVANGEVANGEVASGEVASGEVASGTTHYLATHDLATHDLATHDLATHDLATPYSPSPYSLLTTSLLSIRVCDPACGSGHFLLAAARRIGRALAQVATGEDEPSPEAVRHWTREAIIHCIYGVDKNPLAVDLCKVALWIEGHAPGKPLTFLDAHIKCGDSLVGVFDLEVLDEGIPDEAFDPVTGDDKPTARELKRRNKQERAGQLGLALSSRQAALDEAVRAWQAQLDSPEDTPAQVRRKQAAYAKLQQQENAQRTACDLWTAAFFTPLTAENIAAGAIPTTATLQNYRRQPAAADPRLVAHARALAVRNQFFHWPLEFPHVFREVGSREVGSREVGSREVGSREVEAPLATRHSPFARSGFTVMLGNPPWERIKLQEQEFFAARDLEIAEAPNKAARGRLIERLPKINPTLAQEFADAKQAAEATSKFVRQSGRFPLTAVGDVNTYALFAELARRLLAPTGRTGIIVPTGIATDDTTKDFFGDLVTKGALAQLVGFENEAFIFPSVHHSFRFCILSLAGNDVRLPSTDFVFFCRYFSQINDNKRHFQLTPDEIALINPNTRTMPIFRTRADAELTANIYRRVPVLMDDRRSANPWGIRFMTMFHMANDSGLFEEFSAPDHLPLYEAKMIHQFDHRYATYEGASQANLNAGILPQLTAEQKANPTMAAQPRYWVPEEAVNDRLVYWGRAWLLGFRDVTSAIVERTAIFSLLPRVGVGHTMPLMLPKVSTSLVGCLLGNLNSLPFDYSVRQKVGGVHLSYNYLRQLPVLLPSVYSPLATHFIAPRVLELVYTAWDMAPFAADLWREWRDSELANGEMVKGATDDSLLTTHHSLLAQWEANRAATGGHPWNPPAWANLPPTPDSPFPTPYCPLPPFKWDEDRRARLRAELDAYYARLYGLTRDELRYILDPKDVYGPDFPGETFRVLKEKEERAFGEYRTRRLVLEAWDRLQAELGPVVVRNYREERIASSVVGSGEVRSAPARSARRVAEARAAYEAGRQPALLNEAPAPDSLLPTPPLPAPPQGSRYERLGRLLELGKQRTAAAIGELVAALGDEDENLRWLAAMSLQGIGGETVVATLRAFMAQAPSAAARAEAERVLGKLEDRQV